jgi:hypothetical protein
MASAEKKETGSGSDRERVRAQVGEATSEPLIGGKNRQNQGRERDKLPSGETERFRERDGDGVERG